MKASFQKLLYPYFLKASATCSVSLEKSEHPYETAKCWAESSNHPWREQVCCVDSNDFPSPVACLKATRTAQQPVALSTLSTRTAKRRIMTSWRKPFGITFSKNRRTATIAWKPGFIFLVWLDRHGANLIPNTCLFFHGNSIGSNIFAKSAMKSKQNDIQSTGKSFSMCSQKYHMAAKIWCNKTQKQMEM